MRERNVDERAVAEGGGGISARPMLAMDRDGFIAPPRPVERAAVRGRRADASRRSTSSASRWCGSRSSTSTACCVARRSPAAVLDGGSRSGVTAPCSLLLKDTSGKSVFSVFSADTGVGLAGFSGAGDIVLVPDPTTFRVLPWAPRHRLVLCDVHFPDGSPGAVLHPLDPAQRARPRSPRAATA